MKKVLISISMIVLLVVMSCSTAFADTTEPVIAPTEDETDVTYKGNVKVSGDESVAVGAYALEADASANVTGDVSLDTNNEGYASKGATAIEAMGVDSKATATVGGSVTANGKEQVTGVEIKYSGNVAVGKNVTVTAPLAGGAGVFALDDTTLKIGGNLFVDSAASDSDGRAVGIMINNLGATVLADIGGDVLVKGDKDATMGLVIGSYSEGSAQATNTSVLIHGSLVSSGYGILDASGNGITEVLVGNELKAEEVGIMLTDEEEPTNLKLTVWKIKLNDRGNVAEYQPDNSGILPIGDDMGPHDVNPTEVSYKAATDFEKSIMYIIKCEQPTKGGKISAVDANGNPLAKSFGFDVAHEGDKVFLKTALKRVTSWLPLITEPERRSRCSRMRAAIITMSCPREAVST